MRTFINGAGVDVTTTTNAYLKSRNTAQLVDLFLIGDHDDPVAKFLAAWDTPLTWSYYNKPFINTVIKRGTVESQIGLKVATFSVTWTPQNIAYGTNTTTMNEYQRVQEGFYDNVPLKFFRAVMNHLQPGDLNTYGACVLYGGRVSEASVARGDITFTVKSFLEVADKQLPPNVIELNNTAAQYAGATPVVADGEAQIPRFRIEATSTQEILVATCLGPTASKIYGTNKFQYGYLVFDPGTENAGSYRVIPQSGKVHVSGTDYNQIYVLAPLPFPPAIGDTFYVSTQPPINQQDAAAGFPYYGFPYVPQPESAV